MKKTLLYSLAALASLTLASCNEDFSDWADPQSYDQEDSASAYGVDCSAGSDINCVMPVEDGTVDLITLTATSAEVKSYAVNSLTVNGESIDGTVTDGVVTVDAAELSKLIETQYGSRAAVKRDMEIVVSISLVLSNGDAVTASSSTISGTFTPQAVPTPSDGYYMLGDWQSWNLASPTVMAAQEDGTYKATITTTSSGDNWYKFYRADTWSDSDWDVVNAGAMGCETNGDSSLSNFIVYEGDQVYSDGVQTPVISGEGTYEVTLDPINLTYKIERAETMYYASGNPNSWESTTKNMIFYPQGGNVFNLTTYYDASWDLKFWDESNFGNWDVMFGCVADEDNAHVWSGTLATTDFGCITSPDAGYYTLSVDISNMTYEFTECDTQSPTEYSSISLIGEFNSWNGDLDMTQVATKSGNASHCWYVETTFSSSGELKFRADADWTVNWGLGVDVSTTFYGTAVSGGDNITVPAGTYRIYLNDITGGFVFVAVE